MLFEDPLRRRACGDADPLAGQVRRSPHRRVLPHQELLDRGVVLGAERHLLPPVAAHRVGGDREVDDPVGDELDLLARERGRPPQDELRVEAPEDGGSRPRRRDRPRTPRSRRCPPARRTRACSRRPRPATSHDPGSPASASPRASHRVEVVAWADSSPWPTPGPRRPASWRKRSWSSWRRAPPQPRWTVGAARPGSRGRRRSRRPGSTQRASRARRSRPQRPFCAAGARLRSSLVLPDPDPEPGDHEQSGHQHGAAHGRRQPAQVPAGVGGVGVEARCAPTGSACPAPGRRRRAPPPRRTPPGGRHRCSARRHRVHGPARAPPGSGPTARGCGRPGASSRSARPGWPPWRAVHRHRRPLRRSERPRRSPPGTSSACRAR